MPYTTFECPFDYFDCKPSSVRRPVRGDGKDFSNMLRGTIQESPNEWDEALSQIEFDYNCSKNASTRLSPFEVEVGRIPHSPLRRKLPEFQMKCQSSVDYVERGNACWRIAKNNLARAQAQHKFYADKKRRQLSF